MKKLMRMKTKTRSEPGESLVTLYTAPTTQLSPIHQSLPSCSIANPEPRRAVPALAATCGKRSKAEKGTRDAVVAPAIASCRDMASTGPLAGSAECSISHVTSYEMAAGKVV